MVSSASLAGGGWSADSAWVDESGMRAQIIDQHHLAWLQRRCQDLLQIALEGQPIHAAFDNQCWPHSLMGQRGNRGGIKRRIAWRACHGTFANRRPRMCRSEI